MNIKNSKKIVPATVFAAIIVLLAFSVMSTTVSAQGNELVTKLTPEKGHLGDVVKVTIDVNVDDVTQRVNVVDTLPAEFTYIGPFTVNDNAVNPDVNEQVISYNINIIDNIDKYTIKFNVKVTEANWENPNVKNVVVGTWYDGITNPMITARAAFNIAEFKGLKEQLVYGPSKPEIEQEVNWRIRMGVKNIFDYTMKNTKITENFGGNLKIDSVTKADGTPYTFEYNEENYRTKDATVDIWKDGNKISEFPIPLDKVGVIAGGGHIFWTGKTHKAHFVWNIDDLASDNSKDITIGVSTDTNPAGTQLYTETGDHELNSGATLTFNDEDSMQLSAVAAPIVVEAVSAP